MTNPPSKTELGELNLNLNFSCTKETIKTIQMLIASFKKIKVLKIN